MKFGRAYHLTVEGRSGGPAISIDFPLTLEFNVQHHIFASTNVAELSLYNLSAASRSEISFNLVNRPPRQFKVVLRAGYLSQVQLGLRSNPQSLPKIFDGSVNVAYTERCGSNLVTRINAFDNGDTTSGQPAAVFPPNFSVPKGTLFPDMVSKVMSCLLPNVSVGAVLVSPTPKPLTRARQFTGPVWPVLVDLAREVPGSKLYVENGVCNLLGQNITLGTNYLGVLRAETGLLDVPRFTGLNVMAKCVFEPSLAIGKTLELQSALNRSINGKYKVVAYSHSGTISGVESGEAVSDLTLMSVNAPTGANT